MCKFVEYCSKWNAAECGFVVEFEVEGSLMRFAHLDSKHEQLIIEYLESS